MKTSGTMLLVVLWLVSILCRADAEVLRVDYEGFTVWLDCDKRGATKFRYNAQRDHGNFKRHTRFFLDPQVPMRCQQTSTASTSMRPSAMIAGTWSPPIISMPLPLPSGKAII